MRKFWRKNPWMISASLVMLLSAGGNGYVHGAERTGMTWGFRHYYSDIDTTYVHCYGEPGSPNYGPCDAYKGDTSCSLPLPVLCLKVDGLTRPPYLPLPPGGGMNREYYTGWAEGTAKLTDPVPGNTFTNLSDANAYCAAQLGDGYRVAEFHDGRSVSGMDENN